MQVSLDDMSNAEPIIAKGPTYMLRLGNYLEATPISVRTKQMLIERFINLSAEGRYQMVISGDPVIIREIPTISETIDRLDRVIANVRRYQ